MTLRTWRRDHLTRRIFHLARKALPALSETESEALEAGGVWWDADLFTGNPDWSKLAAVKAPALTDEEKAFVDGPCEELLALADDWQINFGLGELPEEAWELMKREKFFGMIIPKRYGGLEFSAFGHSEVIRRISSRSLTAAVTVMVPNSLGPGELLLQFGTEVQRDYWLPRLADGREIPAFALTSDRAGSDASAMRDTGIVCRGEWNGETVIGIRLDWSKRYITLGPVATVLGLAFRLFDPEGLIGDEEELGITCALVPTHLPGVATGRRHLPAGQMFQNGPTTGEGVFIPLDHVIGGPDHVGKGWVMLMSALAAGRGISLPSLSAAAVAFCAHTTGAYARVREQFGIPIGRFEGVEECLGRLAAASYSIEAARRLTCAGLDEGRSLAVVSAIMKATATWRMRTAVDDAMDVHGGKAIMDGPANWLGNLYRSVPIGITVEGANILTRSMIIFGQGAIRCHPWLIREMLALEEPDERRALDAFDRAFWGHVGHAVATLLRAAGRAWTGALIAPAPRAGKVTRYYRRASRYAAAFALVADVALLTLGGSLKRREMLSARLGDALSELYFLSATLKRFEDDGRPADDLPVVEYCALQSLERIRLSLDGVLANLPNRAAAAALRCLTLIGNGARGPSDALTRSCAALLLARSPTRRRITAEVEHGYQSPALAGLSRAFDKVIAVEPLRRRLRDSGRTPEEAREDGLVNAEEFARLEEAEAAVAAVIAVDHFAAEELVGRPLPQPADAGERTGRQSEAAE